MDNNYTFDSMLFKLLNTLKLAWWRGWDGEGSTARKGVVSSKHQPATMLARLDSFIDSIRIAAVGGQLSIKLKFIPLPRLSSRASNNLSSSHPPSSIGSSLSNARIPSQDSSVLPSCRPLLLDWRSLAPSHPSSDSCPILATAQLLKLNNTQTELSALKASASKLASYESVLIVPHNGLVPSLLHALHR